MSLSHKKKNAILSSDNFVFHPFTLLGRPLDEVEAAHSHTHWEESLFK